MRTASDSWSWMVASSRSLRVPSSRLRTTRTRDVAAFSYMFCTGRGMPCCAMRAFHGACGWSTVCEKVSTLSMSRTSSSSDGRSGARGAGADTPESPATLRAAGAAPAAPSVAGRATGASRAIGSGGRSRRLAAIAAARSGSSSSVPSATRPAVTPVGGGASRVAFGAASCKESAIARAKSASSVRADAATGLRAGRGGGAAAAAAAAAVYGFLRAKHPSHTRTSCPMPYQGSGIVLPEH